MALELENRIMADIGFGHHFDLSNGSCTCRYIRREATDKITRVIQVYHDAGEEICEPDKDLIDILKKVSKVGDRNDKTLTKTWQAASEVIAYHITQTRSTDDSMKGFYVHLKNYLRENFLH